MIPIMLKLNLNMKLCNLLRLILFLPKFIHCSTNEYAEFYDDYNKMHLGNNRQNTGKISEILPTAKQYKIYDYDQYHDTYDYYVISSEMQGLENMTDIKV